MDVLGRNGGGQRATRAVVVRGLHSGLLQRDERFVRQSQPIREFGVGGRALYRLWNLDILCLHNSSIHDKILSPSTED